MVLSDMNVELVLSVLSGVLLLIQLWHYWGIFSRLAFYKKKLQSDQLPPVSVIICARNEDDNLSAFLPLVLQQDYPEYEVIVVNDCSYDNTADILREMERKNDRLKVVTIQEDENYEHGKKFAVLVGIKGAQHEHLLFTDADCKPTGNQWIRHMISNYTPGAEIVLGYGGYEKRPGFLNKLIRFDTFHIALQYLSYALAGKAYMGVGRNLSYQKSTFYQLKGFASHYHIDSGDDDLFINEAATKLNCKIEVAIESHTTSKVKTTWKEWFRQKRRHMTTARLYNPSTKNRLGVLAVSQYLFFVFFILSLCFPYHLYLTLGLFLIRYLSQLIIFKKSMDKLGERDLLLISFALELSLMVVYPLMVFYGLFSKKNKWKK